MPGSIEGDAVGVAVSAAECVAVLISGVAKAVEEGKVGGEIIFADSCELSQETQIHNIIKMTTKKNSVAFKRTQRFFMLLKKIFNI
ncbi:MAG: hypothetical protein IKY41_05055 [Clostridia bacterium]|nr:hypothetical protein [Clostridia bacterium]